MHIKFYWSSTIQICSGKVYQWHNYGWRQYYNSVLILFNFEIVYFPFPSESWLSPCSLLSYLKKFFLFNFSSSNDGLECFCSPGLCHQDFFLQLGSPWASLLLSGFQHHLCCWLQIWQTNIFMHLRPLPPELETMWLNCLLLRYVSYTSQHVQTWPHHLPQTMFPSAFLILEVHQAIQAKKSRLVSLFHLWYIILTKSYKLCLCKSPLLSFWFGSFSSLTLTMAMVS